VSNPGDTSELMSDGVPIRLPHSAPSRCSAITFCELLSKVAPDASGGFGFDGKFFKCGAEVPERALRPSPDFPPTQIVLECGGPGHDRGTLYVLWLLKEGEWCELGRAQSRAAEWALDIRPIAVRALDQREDPKRMDILALIHKLAGALGAILGSLGAEDRAAACAILRIATMRRAATVVLDVASEPLDPGKTLPQ
jgi:hypothetical protein